MARPSFRRALALVAALASLSCGGHYHLNEYSFANRSIALVYMAPPSPGLLTGGYDLRVTDDVVGAMIKAGSGVAKDAEATRARARLDSATSRANVASDLAKRTLERASRYLGTRPVSSADDADFLLEVNMHNFGLDARSSNGAFLYTNAEAVLLDRRTGREIWNINVRGTDRLTPLFRGSEQVPSAVVTAGTLHMLTVADFQQALDQLMNFSSNLMTDELRAALRDARR